MLFIFLDVDSQAQGGIDKQESLSDGVGYGGVYI